MRTTLTLEPDIARSLQERARREGRSFKDVVNESLRRGLASKPARPSKKRFTVKPHEGGFRPGIDPLKLNQLNDEIEVEGLMEETSGTNPAR